jgi:hypothetical protein
LRSALASLLRVAADLAIWGVGLATIIPWAPMFLLDVARVYYAYQWLALFYALLITQSGHFVLKSRSDCTSAPTF